MLELLPNTKQNSTEPTATLGLELLVFLDDLVNGLGHIMHVVPVQPGHADTAVLSHVNVRVSPEPEHLRLRQACEAEHADLVRDVPPAALFAVERFQRGPEGGSHLLDPPAHGPQIVFPFGKEVGVVEDGTGDAGPVCRRVADLGSLQDGELGCNAANGVGRIGPWAGDEVEGAGTLAVESEVLGKGLRHTELEALRDEVADRPGVVFKIARCKALIGAVEKGKMLLGGHQFGELSPLGVGEVDTGGIVGTCMEENDASLGGLLDCGEHTGEIKAFGLRGEIGVGFYREVHVGEYLVMVGPCWGGEVDGLV